MTLQALLEQLKSFRFTDPLSYWQEKNTTLEQRNPYVSPQKEPVNEEYTAKQAYINRLIKYGPGYVFNFTSADEFEQYKQKVCRMAEVCDYFANVPLEYRGTQKTNLHNYLNAMTRELNKCVFSYDDEEFNERVVEKVTNTVQKRLADIFIGCYRSQPWKRSYTTEYKFYHGLAQALDSYLASIGLQKIENRKEEDVFQEEDYDRWEFTQKPTEIKGIEQTFDEIEMYPYAMYFKNEDGEREVRYVKGKCVVNVFRNLR